MSDTNQKQQSGIKDLIAKGREQRYLTYAEVNDHLPEDIADPEQVEDIIQMINDMGITVFETTPLTKSQQQKPPPLSPQSSPNNTAPPIQCACICVRWVRLSC